MPRLARPTGGGNAFRDLNNALHDLHALASWPSLDEICAYLRFEDARRRDEGLEYARLHGISRVNISRLFSAPRLPRPDLMLAVVEYLAKRAYRLDVGKVLDLFDDLWRRALSEQSPSAPGAEGEDDDWPETGENPARPRPRGPRPSGGPATDAGPSEHQPFSLLDIVDQLRPSDPGADRRSDPSTRLLMVNLPYRREHGLVCLTDRVVQGWSQALSIGGTTVAEQPTAADMRRLIADTLNQPLDTAVLWLHAPVVWDVATGEAHFVTRDSELDADGTLWNTVSYTEIQYAVARSSARAVIVVVIAGRSPRVADVYGTRTLIPVGRTQWADTLYAYDYADDHVLSPAPGPRPVFLLWLPDAGKQLDYPGALLREIESSALPGSDLTTGALLGRLRALSGRLGYPEPYGDARYGGEAIVLGRWSRRRDADARLQPGQLHFVLRATGDDGNSVSPVVADVPANRSSRRLADNTAVAAGSAVGDADDAVGGAVASWWLRETWQAGPEFANSVTVTAVGRFAGNDVVVAAFTDKSLRLLDPGTGQAIRTHTYGHPDPVTALAIGTVAGNDVLAVAFADDSLQLWDASTGDRIQTLSHSIGPVVALSIRNDDEGDFIVAENTEHQTWSWEVMAA
jgi:hypothetical protein